MDEFYKAKAKLKTEKSPGPNGLRSELLKLGGSLLDCHRQKEGLTKRLLEGCLKDNAGKKRAHTTCWNRQLQADAKELFSGDAEDWLANPSRKIPENDQHRPNLVGSRQQVVQCSNLN
ncbi:unnamed protein product [Hymenolepis diminuta]|uniref:Uncharacterized protein n=1 Tax=Hymenolepis diminuta TaxID=6216 RepID=A0A564Y2S6_HYMDI|nr:unnamed protein product [Hymenolepis diminuta]